MSVYFKYTNKEQRVAANMSAFQVEDRRIIEVKEDYIE